MPKHSVFVTVHTVAGTVAECSDIIVPLHQLPSSIIAPRSKNFVSQRKVTAATTSCERIDHKLYPNAHRTYLTIWIPWTRWPRAALCPRASRPRTRITWRRLVHGPSWPPSQTSSTANHNPAHRWSSSLQSRVRPPIFYPSSPCADSDTAQSSSTWPPTGPSSRRSRARRCA